MSLLETRNKRPRLEDFYVVEYEEGTIRRRRKESNERMFLLSSKAWSFVVKKIHESFNAGGNDILFEMGQYYGFSLAQEIKKYKLPYEEAIRILAERAAVSGWGMIYVTGDLHSGNDLRARVEKCVFCSERIGRVSKPGCHFFRGIISGMAQVLYNRSYRCIEIGCCATGGKYCEYVLKEDRYDVYSVLEDLNETEI